MSNYKKLLRILLNELFVDRDEPEISYDFIAEMVCRFAWKEKLVELKCKDWCLTKKGKRLLQLEDENE